MVLQATRQETLSTASLRVVGTFIGTVVCAIYLRLLPATPAGRAVCIFVTMLIAHMARIPSHARLGTIKVAVTMVIVSSDPTVNPVLCALLRFIESCMGTAIAVLVIHLWPRAKKV